MDLYRLVIRRSLTAAGLILVLLLAAGLAPAMAAATGSISGVVFFDANGNGIRNSGEAGLAGVRVQAVQGTSYNNSVLTGADGSYSFSGLAAGSYVVTETDLSGYASTTAASRNVGVRSGAITGIDFGDCLPMTLAGIVFDDLDGSGDQGLSEPGVAGASVQVVVDSNGNGLVDTGEPVVGSATTDGQGAFAILGLMAGRGLARVQRSGGSPVVTPLTLISGQISGNTWRLDVALTPLPPPATATPTPAPTATPQTPPTATPTPTAAPGLQVLQQNTSGSAKMAIKKGLRGSQSFRHGVAGGPGYHITQVDLQLSRDAIAPNADLVLTISAGRYGSAVIGSQVNIPASRITNTSSGSSFLAYQVVFASPVGPFAAGTTYYVNFVTTAGNGKAYFTRSSSSNTYAGGVYYKEKSDSGKDAWFQIWGSAAP